MQGLRAERSAFNDVLVLDVGRESGLDCVISPASLVEQVRDLL
jgi:hypothetical protein